ncbi:GPKOW protein, partial [Ramphastos sulfuratus]|nr:GPKOW protein [Ramphastos sulfuratus]
GPCREPGGEQGEAEAEPLAAVEGKELLSARPAPPPPQELIIPLLPPAHRWRNPEPPPSGHASPNHAPRDHTPSDHAPATPLSVEAQAVQELLREARQSQGQGQDSEPPMAIPLPLQEAAPRPQP